MSSSPKEATTDIPNANNKRALSSEPEAQDNSKRANTKTESEPDEDITADDKVTEPTPAAAPTATTTTDEKPKMEGDDVTMETTEESTAP